MIVHATRKLAQRLPDVSAGALPVEGSLGSWNAEAAAIVAKVQLAVPKPFNQPKPTASGRWVAIPHKNRIPHVHTEVSVSTNPLWGAIGKSAQEALQVVVQLHKQVFGLGHEFVGHWGEHLGEPGTNLAQLVKPPPGDPHMQRAAIVRRAVSRYTALTRQLFQPA